MCSIRSVTTDRWLLIAANLRPLSKFEQSPNSLIHSHLHQNPESGMSSILGQSVASDRLSKEGYYGGEWDDETARDGGRDRDGARGNTAGGTSRLCRICDGT